MRYILIALLVLLLFVAAFGAAFGASAQEPIEQIHIVYVEPVGETFTAAEQDYAYSVIADAIQFWDRHNSAALVVADTRVITTEADIYNNLEWSLLYFTTPDVTIFVLDNSTSRTALLDNSAAQSQNYYKVIWAALSYSNAAVITHEFGHILYHLPHHYEVANDIMSLDPYPAYQQDILGCATLAELGKPCKTLYLPIIIH